MTIVVPNNYHAKQLLEINRVACISKDDAFHQDIRPMRIGMLNIMPFAQDYEFNLLHPLGLSIIQVDPIWIRLYSHPYKTSNKKHIDELYISYEEALKKGPLDGLIITGAPVEKMEFKDVRYWDELSEIIHHAKKTCPSTLGLCWAAFALARLEGIDKINFKKKLFGVFEVYNLRPNHLITGELDDVFWCPQSRYAGLDDRQMEEAQKEGIIELLAYGPECGHVIFGTPDNRVIMHNGHPEYNAQRIVFESRRDIENKRDDVSLPANFNLDQPMNRWKSHRNVFFSQWLKYCYMQISMTPETDRPSFSCFNNTQNNV